MEFKSQAEYNSKRDEVLSRFKEDFAKEYYKYDAQFRGIAEMLIRDADPYGIIEALIVNHKEMVGRMVEISQLNARPGYIVVPKEAQILMMKIRSEFSNEIIELFKEKGLLEQFIVFLEAEELFPFEINKIVAFVQLPEMLQLLPIAKFMYHAGIITDEITPGNFGLTIYKKLILSKLKNIQ